MSRRLETVARSSGVLKSKRKRHRDNGIWQKSGAFTELWASTPRPLQAQSLVQISTMTSSH